jgi:hypothetical protein
MKVFLFAAGQHDAEIIMKIRFLSMLTQGATIPTRLLCSAGFAGCPYSFTPHASHPGRTCRVHNPG